MISKWENNKEDPSMEHIRNLSRFFNCSVDYILCLSDKRVIDESPLEEEDPSVAELKEKFEKLYPKILGLSQDEKDKLLKMINIYLTK